MAAGRPPLPGEALMGLATFLRELQENGRVHVAVSPDRSTPALEAFQTELKELDALERLNVAHEAPVFSINAAAWGALTIYQTCQFLIYRDVNANVVTTALRRACPEVASASVCYSVDLTFRYLPDLISQARGIAEGDPLVDCLVELAEAWPLSSVGVKNLRARDVGAFISHASLRRLYADRILERRDESRLDDARVVEAVKESLGGFSELCPEVAGVILSHAKTQSF